MNPERAAMKTIDRENRGDHIKATAEKLLPLHPQIERIMKKIAVKPEDFSSPFDDEMIADDRRHVEKMKKKIREHDKNPGAGGLTFGEVSKLAEVLEYQVIKGINVGKWLPYCKAIKTSEYDDIINGIDLVVAFTKGEKSDHLGIGVDISFSQNLKGKFQRIKDEIDQYDAEDNHLGTVRYFPSAQTGERSPLLDVPRVVAALDLGVMEDLARVKDGGPGHIAQHAIITEMERQLSVFADYAQKKNPLCLDQIMRAQNFVHLISQHLQSEEQLQSSEYGKNIKIQEAIEDGLSLFR